MVNLGMVMYSYGGGASSVEIPSEEYLKEKRMEKRLPKDYSLSIQSKTQPQQAVGYVQNS